jgi:hypothetical protein
VYADRVLATRDAVEIDEGRRIRLHRADILSPVGQGDAPREHIGVRWGQAASQDAVEGSKAEGSTNEYWSTLTATRGESATVHSRISEGTYARLRRRNRDEEGFNDVFTRLQDEDRGLLAAFGVGTIGTARDSR